jgi:steroid 5-alpha reductase family enzyme
VGAPTLFLTTLALCAAAMFALWLVSLALRDASIVDVYWGPGFAVIGAAAWLLGSGGDDARRALDGAGAALVIFGLFFEAVGDAQLTRFRADPANRNRVLDRGLWRYTRHPNYFGDCCVWGGLYVIAAATPLGVWTVLSPIAMTFLLLRVSGVALLERSIGKRRPGYADYAARTSAFVPLARRRNP